MFEQTFVQTGKTNKGWTVVLSTVIQLFIILLASIVRPS